MHDGDDMHAVGPVDVAERVGEAVQQGSSGPMRRQWLEPRSGHDPLYAVIDGPTKTTAEFRMLLGIPASSGFVVN